MPTSLPLSGGCGAWGRVECDLARVRPGRPGGGWAVARLPSPGVRGAGAATSIGVLNEGPLHASLKRLCAEPGDRLEVPVDGYQVDILRGDLIVEIQTGSFARVARKLRDLVERHRVRLVHPLARERWIVKLAAPGEEPPPRRRSPKRGGFEQVFEELVSFPDLLAQPNFELELVATREEELRRFDPRRRRRRGGWVVVERRLLEVVERRLVRSPRDLAALLPADLPEPFRTSDLAEALGRPRDLAQKAAYCLRRCDGIAQVGKDGNALVYARRRPRRRLRAAASRRPRT